MPQARKPSGTKKRRCERVPRHVTTAALKHFTGMKVDVDAVAGVEEM